MTIKAKALTQPAEPALIPLAQMESGTHRPRSATRAKLATALGITAEQLA